VKDIHYEHLKNNKSFDDTNYENIKNALRKEIVLNKKQAAELATNLLNYSNPEILKLKILPREKTESVDSLPKSLIFTNRKDLVFLFLLHRKNLLSTITEKELLQNQNIKKLKFLKFWISCLKTECNLFFCILKPRKKKRFICLLPLKVNKDIQDELKKIEEENDLVLFQNLIFYQ
jgi:hypothetical protein